MRAIGDGGTGSVLRWGLLWLACAAALGAVEPAAADQPARVTLTAGPEQVLVYPRQARVTRSQQVDLPAGRVELVWRDLPAALHPDTLRAAVTGPEGLRLVRVRYELLPSTAAGQRDRDQLDARRAELDLELRRIDDARALAASYAQLLERIADPNVAEADSTSDEADATALAPAAWRSALDFVHSESEATLERLRELNQRATGLRTDLAAVEAEIAAIDVDKVPAIAAAIIACEVPTAGPAQVELSYLVGNVAWYPAYAVSVDAEAGELELVRQAWIAQHTGEDWNDVAITVSTGSPHALATIPHLQPWRIGHDSAGVIEPVSAGDHHPQALTIERPDDLAASESIFTANPLARRQAPRLAEHFGYRGDGSLHQAREALAESEASGAGAFLAIEAGGGSAGAFGNRQGGGRQTAVGRFGGSRVSESAMESSLDFLAQGLHRGHWGSGPQQLADHAMAITTFLGAGYDHTFPNKYRDTVAQGLDHLLARSSPAQLRGEDLWTHCQVALALAEAYAMTNDPDLRAPTSAVIAALEQRITAVPWHLHPSFSRRSWPDGPHTLAFAIMALKSARAAGLPVGEHTWLQVMSLLPELDAAATTPLDVAAAAFSRIMLGFDSQDPELQAAADRIMANLPDFRQGAFDHRFVYLASLSIFQLGGERWERWNSVVRDDLIALMDADGATPPIGRDGNAGGGQGSELYATTLASMSLQVYYRYAPVHAGGRGGGRASAADRVHYISPALSAGGRDHRDRALRPVTLVSDGAFKTVALAQRRVAARFEHHAVPLVSDGAWLQAVAINESDRALLPGEVRLTDGGEFVGSVFLEQVEPGEAFALPLGLDPAVTLTRERAADSQQTGFRGQTTRTSYAITIGVHNRHARPVQVVVSDRIPRPADNRIRIENVAFGGSEPDYEPDSEDGRVRFDIAVDAGGSADLSIAYAIEHPADLAVVQEDR